MEETYRCTKCTGVTPFHNYCVFDDGTVFGYDRKTCYILNDKEKEKEKEKEARNMKRVIDRLKGKG